MIDGQKTFDNSLPFTIRMLFILIGFNALVAQVLFLREFLILFNGNEISIGFILAIWLFWTGLGSFLLGRIYYRFKSGWLRILTILQSLLVLLIPVTLTGIRYSRYFLHILPGESGGFFSLFWAVTGFLSLFCLLSGGLFSLGSRYLQRFSGGDLSSSAGRFYWYETLGSSLGGLLLTLYLLPHWNAMQIVLGVVTTNGLALIFINWSYLKKRVTAIITLGMVTFFAFIYVPLDRISLNALWQNFHIVDRIDSPYANLTLIKYNDDLTLYSNGTAIVHFANPQESEELVHFALLIHPKPERILLIGGGAGGALDEILKHPSVRKIDYVETDPNIIRITEEASTDFRELLQNNSRIETHIIDGRLFLKETKQRYDVIILAAGEPLTAALNRFYTRQFFVLIQKRLTEGGIFSFQTVGSDNYISDAQADYLRCLKKTLQSVFLQMTEMPGSRIHFFVANQNTSLQLSAKLFLERLKERGILTKYIREYYLPFRLMPDRIADLEEQIKPRTTTRINSDFLPVAFYYYLVYWSSQHRGIISELLTYLRHFPFWQILLVLILFFAIILFTGRKKSPVVQNALTMLVMGFSMLALELVLLLAFQAVYGYVYQQVALLIGFFMAGMAGGTRFMLRKSAAFSLKKHVQILRFLQAGVLVLIPLLYFFFIITNGLTHSVSFQIASHFFFPLFAFLTGALGGAQFPVISAMYLAHSKKRNVGFIYGIDLLGALLAALLMSIFIIPLYGFLCSLLLIACLNLLAMATRNPD
ncbi:MAG TPA: hypothetical protein EYP36_10950 [Calditrichaeota bacterium]|nr:hypothetical protein [Calditrichota bacterium]